MKGKIFLSLIIGASLGSVTVLVLLFILPELAMPLGLIAFGRSSIAMHVVLTVSEWRLNKKYLVLEQRITQPVLYKTNGNFAGGPVVNCNLYFCQKSIVIASVESNPYLFDEVAVGDSRTGVEPNCPATMHFRIFRRALARKIGILLRKISPKSIKNAFAGGCEQF